MLYDSTEAGEQVDVTYTFDNYEGDPADNRMITLPVQMTQNGIFSIGIAQDSTALTQTVERLELYVRVLGILITALSVLCVYFIFRIFAERQRAEYELARANDRTEIEELRVRSAVNLMKPHFLYTWRTLYGTESLKKRSPAASFPFMPEKHRRET